MCSFFICLDLTHSRCYPGSVLAMLSNEFHDFNLLMRAFFWGPPLMLIFLVVVRFISTLFLFLLFLVCEGVKLYAVHLP